MADIDAIARRPAAYLAETGLPQLTSGFGFFIGGCFVLIQRLLPGTALYVLSTQWIGIGCCVAVFLGIAAIRRRIVFPRGGYVAPRGRTPRLLYFSTFALVAVTVWVFARARALHRFDLLDSSLIWPGFAILFAVICLYGGWQQKNTGMTCFGVYLVCLAPLLWWLPATNNYERSAYFQVAAGAPLAAAGAVRLRHFLRANPMQPKIRNE
jgi:hypothetical protein